MRSFTVLGGFFLKDGKHSVDGEAGGLRFFNTYLGMFLIQTVLHAFIAVIIIEISFYSLEIRDHFSRFRYRLLVLTLPISMFPVYQIINPERGSIYFRENTAILDVNRWLAIKIWDIVPIYLLFLAMLSIITLLFLFQEIFPIVLEKIPKPDYAAAESDRDLKILIDGISRKLKIESPPVKIVDEAYPLLFTSGIKGHAIILSNGLLAKLSDDELESALAHELVHIFRRSSAKTQLIYILRMLMFYNPVSLIEFRRLVQDDEFICDGITVSLIKKPQSLVSALKVFYDRQGDMKMSKLSAAKDIIESHSYNMLLNERINEIQGNMNAADIKFGWMKFILIIIIILKINYMVV